MVRTIKICWFGPLLQDPQVNGGIIDSSTVRRLTLEKKEISLEKEKMRSFEKDIEEAIVSYTYGMYRLLIEVELP